MINTQEVKNNGLYLELDSLYDTRLASLDYIDPKVAKLAIAKGYFERKEDVFPFVSKEQFRKLYDTRGLEILDRAIVTRIPEIMQNFITSTLEGMSTSPFKEDINVYLNIYPYKIDKITATKMLEPLANLCGKLVNVNIVNWSNAQFTLPFCRANIALIIKYDYEEWLEVHTQNDMFRKCQIPDVTLFVPKLYFNKAPTESELTVMMRDAPHPFRALEKAASPVIGLNTIDLNYYNAVLPKEIIEEINQEYKTLK
ncbi:MAG TPA: hypothetical protein PLH48_05800 [Acinetobacter johnsonii]|nr:hypothetical protein [Acinetobacter johnsonii]